MNKFGFASVVSVSLTALLIAFLYFSVENRKVELFALYEATNGDEEDTEE